MEKPRVEKALTTVRCQLKVLGKIPFDLTHKGTICTQAIYVVKGVKNNLLGFPAIKALNLLSHVESIDENVVSKYPSLFLGWEHLHMNIRYS